MVERLIYGGGLWVYRRSILKDNADDMQEMHVNKFSTSWHDEAEWWALGAPDLAMVPGSSMLPGLSVRLSTPAHSFAGPPGVDGP
jgi:hypothetical protein